MANDETQRLVTMANDIAVNLASYSDSAERTADHIKRFWAPRMQTMLCRHMLVSGDGLSDIAQQAVGCLDANN